MTRSIDDARRHDLERLALCELFDELGPDEPTLCGDWTTRDLAAHLVVRERRPDAGPGLVLPFLAGHAEQVRQEEATRPYADIVERVRRGPPRWNPLRFEPFDTLANSIEFFVHHEDVRRAQPGWAPRELDAEQAAALTRPLTFGGSMLTRRAGVGIVVAPSGQPELRLHKGEPTVTIAGPIGECVLYVYGRKEHAQVELSGPADAQANVRTAPFGF